MFWRDKKVFVTGHTGFKGSWLSLWLQKQSSLICGYALEPPTSPNLFVEAQVAEGMTSLCGDITDYPTLLQAMKAFSPHIVFHLAAQSLVRESYRDPRNTFMTNVIGTLHVLEAARECGVSVVVVVTSDKCYENQEWLWPYQERDRLGGHDPYSSSKACAELLCASYQKSFGSIEPRMSIATARAGNVIGGGDWASDRLIPDTIRSFVCQDILQIRSPRSIRPWQHVLEPLGGYLTLAEKLWEHGKVFAQAWNFGPPDSDCRTVQEIVSLMAKQWGCSDRWNQDEKDHPHEASLLKLDSSKARTLLGWRTRWNLEYALQQTVALYRIFYEGRPLRPAIWEQIAAYEHS